MKCFLVEIMFDSPTCGLAVHQRLPDGRWFYRERIVTESAESAIEYLKDLRTRFPAPLTLELHVVGEREYPGEHPHPFVPIDGPRFQSGMEDSPYAAALTRFRR